MTVFTPADLPGKYNEACVAAQNETRGDVVLLIVINGTRGNGFSVGINGARVDVTQAVYELPAFLRVVADTIAQQVRTHTARN